MQRFWQCTVKSVQLNKKTFWGARLFSSSGTLAFKPLRGDPAELCMLLSAINKQCNNVLFVMLCVAQNVLNNHAVGYLQL